MLSKLMRLQTALVIPWIVLLHAFPVHATPPKGHERIAVAVDKVEDTVTIDVSFYAPVPVESAWEVLTDFEHMAEIVSNLEASRVSGRNGSKLIVMQRGRVSSGPLSYSFESSREVELKPYEEIHGRMISGNMKRLEGITRLTAEGEGTRIVNHGEFVPDIWIPPFVGLRLVERETRKQFQEMRDEMMRRQAARQKSGPP
jgi:uncharacterized membrane protein